MIPLSRGGNLLAYNKVSFVDIASLSDLPWEVHVSSMVALLEQASRVATRARTPTDLDNFADYIESSAIITRVTAYSVTAEGGESTRTYEPREGLAEEHYHRFAYDDLSKRMLSWGVMKNLLRKRGLTEAQITYARQSVPEEMLPVLVEYHSFEIVAEALASKGKEHVESPREAQVAPVGMNSSETVARSVSSRLSSDLGTVLSVLDERLVSIEGLLKGMSESGRAVRTTIEPEYLSAADAARFLGVAPSTLEYLRKARRLRSVLVGDQRGFVYPIAELRGFASKKTLETAGESLKRLEARRRSRR